MTRIARAASAACLAVLYTMTAVAGESAFPDIQRILDKGKLLVAVLAKDAAPMIMTDEDGTLIGSEIELARDIATKLDVALEFVRTAGTYDGVVDIVASGEADIAVSFLSSGVERAKWVLFSQPYVKQSARVFYNRAAFAQLQRNFKIETLKEIDATANVSTLEIGVLEGSVYQTILERDYSRYRSKTYRSLAEMMTAVREGRIFAGVHGELQVSYYMHLYPSTAIYVAVDPEVHQPSDISIAVRPDSPNLLRWMNVYLASHVGLLDSEEIVARVVKEREDSE